MELTLDPDPNYISVRAHMRIPEGQLSLWALQQRAESYVRQRVKVVGDMEGEVVAAKVVGDHVECMITIDLLVYPDAAAQIDWAMQAVV